MITYLKFEASWCHQCKLQDNIIKNLDIPVKHIDVDEDESLAEQYNIKVMPTMVLINEESNKELARFEGVTQVDKLKEEYNKYA